jgi:hypothetical protein
MQDFESTIQLLKFYSPHGKRSPKVYQIFFVLLLFLFLKLSNLYYACLLCKPVKNISGKSLNAGNSMFNEINII